MAKARMLHKSISLSKQVNNLSLATQLLLTWMIAHADDEGRLKGGADDIKATVVPRKNWSLKRIDSHLEEIKKAGLVHRWQKNGEWFIEFVKWKEHQSIRASRFKKSNLPSFDEERTIQRTPLEQPKDNQETPQLNIIENNQIKSNPKTEASQDIYPNKKNTKGIGKLRKTMYTLGLKKGETNA